MKGSTREGKEDERRNLIREGTGVNKSRRFSVEAAPDVPNGAVTFFQHFR
jgi:hypothetical protein